MIGIMDLNAPPLPEDDDDTFEQHYEGYSTSEKDSEHVNHAEHVESAVDILRRVPHSPTEVYLVDCSSFPWALLWFPPLYEYSKSQHEVLELENSLCLISSYQ